MPKRHGSTRIAKKKSALKLVRDVFLIAAMAAGSLFLFNMKDDFTEKDIDRLSHRNEPIVFQPPFQKDIQNGKFSFKVGSSIAEPVAVFDITGVVLARSRYFIDERTSWSSLDIAVGWGQMSNPAYLSDVWTTVSGRQIQHQHLKEESRQTDIIFQSSANLHIIPANARVKKMISDVHKGNLVSMTGYLVNITRNGEMTKSSLSRSDRGKGAGEIFYVEDVVIDPTGLRSKR